MKREKLCRLSALLLLPLLLLLLPFTQAFQVSPAAKRVDLDGSLASYELRVINDQGLSMRASFSVKGPLAAYVTIHPSTLRFTPEERELRATISLAEFPEELLVPGKNQVPIIVTSAREEEGQFTGAVTLRHNLNLYLAYPGAFLEGRLALTELEEEPLVTLALENLGLEATSGSGQLSLLLPDDSERRRLSLGSVDIAPGAIEKLVARLDPLPRGAYTATATFDYLDRGVAVTRSATAPFSVGSPVARFGDFNGSLEAGSIQRVLLPVTIDWNDDVASTITLFLKDGEQTLAEAALQDSFTPGENQAELFLELESVAPGNYTLAATAAERATILGDASWAVTLKAPETRQPPSLDLREAGSLLPLLLLLVALLLLVFYLARRKRQ